MASMPHTATFVYCKLFPARESLVSDIPAWDGKIGNPFYSVGGFSQRGSKI
jgi:hypothetical protein